MSTYLAWLRHAVGPHLVPLVYATAVIRDLEGRILFQRRADFDAAWWGLPGGLLEPGETPEACLWREVKEETGLRLASARLTGVYSSPRHALTYPNGDRVQQITQCYACEVGDGHLTPDGDEILGLRFFPADALPPRPPWYAEMLRHALAELPHPFFDPPERVEVDTPYPTLMSLRRVIGSAPVIWPGAAALIVDEAGRVLLQHRRDNGLWGLPAGALDAGESLAHTVIRETIEETGLHVAPTRLVSTYAGDEIIFPNGDRIFPVGHWFACRIVGGRLRADGREATEVGFFSPDHLPPLLPRARERVTQAITHLTAVSAAVSH
jgi:8-oxo-dGTP pyrophosphatase MutT (NUDIX family)